MAAGDRFHRHEADVVAVAGVARARISEPDEETHGCTSRRALLLLRLLSAGRRSSRAAAAAPAAGAAPRRRSRSACGRSGSGGGRSGSSGFGGGLQFFRVARRRHDGDQRRVGVAPADARLAAA